MLSFKALPAVSSHAMARSTTYLVRHSQSPLKDADLHILLQICLGFCEPCYRRVHTVSDLQISGPGKRGKRFGEPLLNDAGAGIVPGWQPPPLKQPEHTSSKRRSIA